MIVNVKGDKMPEAAKDIGYNVPQDVIDYVKWRTKQEFWKKHKENLKLKIMDYYNAKIERIAKNLDSEIRVNEFYSASMTYTALKKGNYISKRVSQLGKRPLEIYMFLINELKNYRNNDRIIKDVYIGKGQVVTQSTCDITPRGHLDSCIDIKQNLESRIMAWAHSHGSHRTFHSARDDENVINFTDDYGIKRNIEITRNSKKIFGIDFHYSPSVVFNSNNSNPFIAIAVKYPQFTGKGIIYKTNINHNCLLNIVNDNERTGFDKELIDAQILSNVSYNGKRLVDIYSYGNLKVKDELLTALVREPRLQPKPNIYVQDRIKSLIKRSIKDGTLDKITKDRADFGNKPQF